QHEQRVDPATVVEIVHLAIEDHAHDGDRHDHGETEAGATEHDAPVDGVGSGVGLHAVGRVAHVLVSLSASPKGARPDSAPSASSSPDPASSVADPASWCTGVRN